MSETAIRTWPPVTSDEYPRISRLPAYVFAQVNEEKRQQEDAGVDVIDLGMGNPDLGTPGHIVEEMVRHARDPRHHRYSASRGITALRENIAAHYASRYSVELDPDTETVVTIGAKEGIAHLMLALLDFGDSVIVPSPAYPIHTYSVVFAGGQVVSIPLPARPDLYVDTDAFLASIDAAMRATTPKPKGIFLSFPNNPTALVVDLDFFERVVEACRRHELLLFHDFAYADTGFEAPPPSVLQVPGAKDIAVEIFSMSKSYSMAGWRVGFCVGNSAMVQALTRIKSYLDYGIFQPLQIAAAHALAGPQECVVEARETYRRRRDALVSSLRDNGWPVPTPPSTMFLWSELPEKFRDMGSVEFARMVLRETGVVISPGIGFGSEGEGHVRFALIEDEARLQEAGQRLGRILG